MAIARALAADPWGRFGGREGKMARIARMEAEAAARANAALNATLGEKGKQEEEGGEEEDKSAAPSKQKKKHAGGKKEAEKAEKKEKNQRKESSSSNTGSKASEAKKTIVVPPLATPEAPATPLYRPPAGWWGNSFFVHAGRLEGISDSKGREEKGQEKARGFTDADQEALAERTTALKAAGKRGLGAASSKKEKAVGHEWKGSKVVFGDGDGENGENGENGDGENDGDDKRERKKQKKEKESKEAPPVPSLDVSSLKWKKAAEAALSQGGTREASKKKGLPVSELAARVAAALSAKGAAEGRGKAWASKVDLEAALGRSLRSLCESSSRFEVDGKGRVKLAAAKK